MEVSKRERKKVLMGYQDGNEGFDWFFKAMVVLLAFAFVVFVGKRLSYEQELGEALDTVSYRQVLEQELVQKAVFSCPVDACAELGAVLPGEPMGDGQVLDVTGQADELLSLIYRGDWSQKKGGGLLILPGMVGANAVPHVLVRGSGEDGAQVADWLVAPRPVDNAGLVLISAVDSPEAGQEATLSLWRFGGTYYLATGTSGSVELLDPVRTRQDVTGAQSFTRSRIKQAFVPTRPGVTFEALVQLPDGIYRVGEDGELAGTGLSVDQLEGESGQLLVIDLRP